MVAVEIRRAMSRTVRWARWGEAERRLPKDREVERDAAMPRWLILVVQRP